MKLFQRATLTIAASLLLFTPFIAFCSDETNRTSSTSVVFDSGEQIKSYSLADILDRVIDKSFDENGAYKPYGRKLGVVVGGEWWSDLIAQKGGVIFGIERPRGVATSDTVDPRALSFDKENFGSCRYFYISDQASAGGYAFNLTIDALFEKNDAVKRKKSDELKKFMEQVQDEKYIKEKYEYWPAITTCGNWRPHVVTLSKILSAVIGNVSYMHQNLDKVNAERAASRPQISEYTTKEIIDILPVYIGDDGASVLPYVASRPEIASEIAKAFTKERADAFNEKNFGQCSYFYIPLGKTKTLGKDYEPGGYVFLNVLDAMFPSSNGWNEAQKAESRERMISRANGNIKEGLLLLESPSIAGHIGAGNSRPCTDQAAYLVRFKQIVNEIIKAGPKILEVNQSRVLAKNQEKEKQAIALRESFNATFKKQDEQAQKIRNCQNTNEYQLYRLAGSIERNQRLANIAQQEIDRQNEGAKYSGVVDKQVMYENGKVLADVKNTNKKLFESYKQLGGTATNVQSVHSVGDDPCGNI